MTDPANTPSTDTTQLRVEACLAEYKVLSDEIRMRNTMQVVAVAISAFLIFAAYTEIPPTRIGVLQEGSILKFVFRPNGMIAGGVVFSLLGAYLLSQATAITRIQRYIDSHIRPSVESALGHSLMEWHGMMHSERKGQPFLKMVARHMPIHIALVFVSLFSVLAFPFTSYHEETIALAVSIPEANPAPAILTWLFFLIGLLCLGWYIRAFLKLRKEYAGNGIIPIDQSA